MNQLSRSMGHKLAAVLLWTIALLGMITVGIPMLAAAVAGNPTSAPFALVLFSFAIDSITIVVAYGVWQSKRWGLILAIFISAFNALLNTGGAILDPNVALKIMTGTFAIASLFIIYLCIRQAPKALTQSA